VIIKKGLQISIFILLIININVFALNRAVVDITTMDITALSEALDAGLITSEELVNLYLDRINEYDEKYNAIISINENALADAKRLDEERANGNVRSLLHGIPIVVKDNIDVYGMPTTGGARALSDNMPNTNAFAVQRLIDAGAIVIAKTNMSEFGFRASSSISSFGRVNNAFNIDLSPYGSSGGTAVAVAASFAAAGLGTDTNSSVRSPAGANNVIGLRPTLGLISRTGVLPYDVRRDTIGPITRTVEDAIILMNIMNAPDETDDLSINQESIIYESKRENLEGIVIGVPEAFIRGTNQNALPENRVTYSVITNLMKQALENLEEKGAEVVFIDEYWTFQTSNWYHTSVSGFTFCDGFNRYIRNTTGTIRSFHQLAGASGRTVSLDTSFCNSTNTFANQNAIKARYREFIENLMERYNIDVIAYPANINQLIRHDQIGSFVGLSYHASSTINFPSITLPIGFDEDGLPYGIEFMVPTNQDDLLLEIAAIHEVVNGNNNIPEIAPPLYEIPDEVQKLVNNYLEVLGKKSKINLKEEWLEKVQTFFRGYSQNENAEEEARYLNEEHEANLRRTQLIETATTIFNWIIKVLVFLFLLIILLLIRKAIRRRKRRKN